MLVKYKRIGIFIFYYPVAFSPSILDTALYWANNGYEVDLLVDRFIFSDIKLIHPLIKITYCANLFPILSSSPYAINSIKNEEKTLLEGQGDNYRLRIKFNKTKIFISKYVPKRVKSVLGNIRSRINGVKYLLTWVMYSLGVFKYVLFKKYTYFIAFEPEGLVTAFLIGKIKKVSFYYHSLEIYEPNTLKEKTRKYLERIANQKASFTLIQDEYRAKELIVSNKIKADKIKFFPVSAYGPPYKEKSGYLHQLFNISDKKKIILYLGAIYSDVYSMEVAEQTTKETWKEDWVLVFHGFGGNKSYLEEIYTRTSRERVFLSLHTIEQKELDMLTSSADVGIALYRPNKKNNEYTIFSSGKIAQYFRFGLPIIVGDFKCTHSFMDQYKCGCCIQSPSELSIGLEKIFANYQEYRMKTFEAFDKKYNFEINYLPIYELVNRLIGTQST